MFNVGDRVRVKDGDFAGSEGTLVLITEDGGEGLDYIVDVEDNNEEIDFFVRLITAFYGVPETSIPFHQDNLELV